MSFADEDEEAGAIRDLAAECFDSNVMVEGYVFLAVGTDEEGERAWAYRCDPDASVFMVMGMLKLAEQMLDSHIGDFVKESDE